MEKDFEIESVAAVEKPPRARVTDVEETPAQKLERKRDYLDGFLAAAPPSDSPNQPGGALYDAIIERLRGIFDPEIPVNIYDLGLIYAVEVADNGEAVVTMTLTTPNCPVAESMPAEVEIQVGSVPGISHATVNLVFTPPWDPSKMSDDAKLELGML